MSRIAPNINRFWADLIVGELVRNGVDTFFIAPGSRSSPLVVAIAEHQGANALLHFDERGSAFAALGYGRARRRAAVWVTTSGTAAANGFPAVVEASQSNIPLLALTADRPPELRDAGANQAIDQIRLFGHYARWFFDLPCPTTAVDPAFVLTTIDHAVHRTKSAPGGPVHINCPFREPLAPREDDQDLPLPPGRWSEGDAPYATYHTEVLEPNPDAVTDVKGRIAAARRGLIVVGELPTLADAENVLSFVLDLGWPVAADVTSQLRLGDTPSLILNHPHFTSAAFADSAPPDLVLRIGGAISSKDIQKLLDHPQATVVAVQDHPVRRDPGHNATVVIRSSIRSFCSALAGVSSGSDRTWVDTWLEADDRISRYLSAELRGPSDVSEPAVASSITGNHPHDHALFIASSMPIRDVDMFGSSAGPLRRIAANRGASGIDGTVASAFGYQIGSGIPVTAVVGDLALLHDLNSLALLGDRPLVVIAINNGGGGIFNFLPIADYPDVFEPWFTTPHEWSFEHAARMFGIAYERPKTMDRFTSAYRKALDSGTAALVEVVSNRNENRRLHTTLRDGALKAARTGR